jgi:heterotetrameric sarcosine oxidase gamma subunit
MSNPGESPFSVEAAGLRVEARGDLLAASLRYFDAAGSFAAAVREATGQAIPAALAAGFNAGSFLMLAWRSPTETLLLCNDRAAFAELERRLLAAADGCMVDQTGGLRVYRVQGPRAVALLQRIGAATVVPGAGEARAGRMAELQVLTACLQTEEYLLVVERAYADHLVGWIRATVADFD